jgi:hypothetical protein
VIILENKILTNELFLKSKYLSRMRNEKIFCTGIEAQNFNVICG